MDHANDTDLKAEYEENADADANSASAEEALRAS
jgi:hypothetical protein